MRVAILGAGGQGRVLLDLIRAAGEHACLGWLDSQRPLGSLYCERPILGSDRDLAGVVEREAIEGLILGIGDNAQRQRLARAIGGAHPSLVFPTLVHPKAYVAADAVLSPGVVIAAGAIVQSGAMLGAHVLINTAATVDHECRLGDFSSLAPRACLAGRVELGEATAICLAAAVSHNRIVGPHTVVGAGATVLHDLPGYVVAYGTPARVVRSRSSGESYL